MDLFPSNFGSREGGWPIAAICNASTELFIEGRAVSSEAILTVYVLKVIVTGAVNCVCTLVRCDEMNCLEL